MSERPEVGAGVADRDLSGKTVLVTGSTSGIGREAALAFGRLGADVLVHGRDAEAGRQVLAELEAEGADGEFFRADFTDTAAVSELAASVRESVAELDVLANNAGGYFRNGAITAVGVERTFHVNHLAGYQLTAELLPVLADDARVVTTSSGAHRGPPIDYDDLKTIDDYSGWRAYQRSKLANVLFTVELAERFEETDRQANAFHPGGIPGSGFFRFLPGPLSGAAQLLGKIPGVPTPADGAETLVYLACGDVTASGRYFVDCAPKTPDDPARDLDAARELWTESARLLGIEEPLADAAHPAADD